MKRWLALTLLAMGAHVAHAAAQAAPAEEPARIEMRASPAAGDAKTGMTTIAISIRHGASAFRLAVERPGPEAAALARQRKTSGWKDGYLFVRDDCRGGNAWRCVVDHVFTFVEHKDGRRLVYVGEVQAGDDCLDDAGFGCALYQGEFTDVYDRAEYNPASSHADAPAPLLAMRVRSGEFVVDLDETWGRNQERFRAGERCLAAPTSGRESECVDGITPLRAYLFNALLAAYTRRADTLKEIQTHARDALCADVNEERCGERLRGAVKLLAAVKPGERPRPRGKVAAGIGQ